MVNTSTLSDSETKNFIDLFENLPNAMILIGQDYQIRAINQQAFEMIQLLWNYELRVDVSLLSLATIFNLSDFEEHFKEALSGKLFTEERCYKDKEVLLCLEFTYIPVKARSGEVVAVCLSFVNISERKKIEALLVSSMSTNQALLNAMPDMLFRISRDGVFVNFKAGNEEKLLTNPENFIGKRVSEVLPPAVAEKILAYVEKALQTGKLQGFEYQLEIEGTLSFFEARFVVSGEDEVMVIVRDITERKQAENLLKRYQLLAQNSLDMILFIRQDGAILEANQAAVLAYGYTLEELTSLSIRDLRANDTLPQVDSQMQQAHLSGIRFETLHRRKDGTTFPVEVVCSETIELNGERVLLSVIRDITERKQTEEALRESEERYRSVVNTMSEGVVLHDADGTILTSNPSARQILGLFEGELAGRDSADSRWGAIHEDGTSFPGETHPAMITLSTSEPCSGVVMGLQSPSSPTRWISINTEPLFQPDKITLRGVVASFVDITRQKEIGAALRRSEERYRSVVNSTKEVIFQTDATGHWTFLNSAWVETTGFSMKESLGENFLNYVHPDDRERNLELFQLLIERKIDYYRDQVRYLTTDGRLRWVEVYTRLILDENKVILGTSGSLRDITGQYLADKRLQHRLQFEELIATISTNFANVSTKEIDNEINQALAAIGRFSRADCAFIFLFSEDNSTQMGLSYEWVEEGIASHKRLLQNLPLASFPWMKSQIREFGILNLTDLDLIPEEARYEREALENQSVQSLLIVPLIYGKKPLGFLGFEATKTKKTWSSADINLLKVLGEIFTNSIQRKITEQLLIEERNFAQLVMNTMGQGLATTDVAGQFQFVNLAYTRMLGYSSEELLGRNPAEFYHPEDVAQRNENYRHSISTTGHTYEGRMIHRDGRILNITATVVPLYRENQLKGTIGVITDITARKQAEEALHQSESRLQTVVSNVPMMLFAVDQKGVATFANGRGFKELGVDSTRIIGHAIGAPFTVAHKDIAEKIHQALEGEVVNTILPMRGKTYEFWLSPIREEGGQVSGAIGVALDVSEKRKMIEERYEQARKLSVLEERQRIARDLHDSVSQVLYSIGLGVNAAQDQFEKRPDQLPATLKYLASLAKGGMSEMQALLLELRPELLARLGLVVALTRQTEVLHTRYQLEVVCELESEPEVSLKIKEALYRIAQEALHNVIKHARATRIELSLKVTASRQTSGKKYLLLQIQDNGRGFEVSASFPGHLGLPSMQERAEMVGGRLKITSGSDIGTFLQVTIPLN